MYYPKTHEALGHTFVTCNELLTLHRNLRACRFFPNHKRGILEMGRKILSNGNTRFPENQMYYDLGHKSVGLVYSELLQLQHCDYNVMLPEQQLIYKTNFDKAVNLLSHLLKEKTADPTIGLYDQESFEKHFGLVWDEGNCTSE